MRWDGALRRISPIISFRTWAAADRATCAVGRCVSDRVNTSRDRPPLDHVRLAVAAGDRSATLGLLSLGRLIGFGLRCCSRSRSCLVAWTPARLLVCLPVCFRWMFEERRMAIQPRSPRVAAGCLLYQGLYRAKERMAAATIRGRRTVVVLYDRDGQVALALLGAKRGPVGGGRASATRSEGGFSDAFLPSWASCTSLSHLALSLSFLFFCAAVER